MAKSQKVQKSQGVLRDELKRFRDIAYDYYCDQVTNNIFLMDGDKIIPPKKGDAHFVRINNLIEIEKFLHNKAKLPLEKEIAIWKKIAKKVLIDIEEDDPDWCGEELDRLNEIRNLLGMETIRNMTFIIRVPEDPLFYDETKLYMTITDKDGNIIIDKATVREVR